MSNVITRLQFGNPTHVRRAKASNLAYKRAIELGYSHSRSVHFAKVAKAEANEWEDPELTAFRVVVPPKATFTGKA